MAVAAQNGISPVEFTSEDDPRHTFEELMHVVELAEKRRLAERESTMEFFAEGIKLVMEGLQAVAKTVARAA